MNTEDQNQDFAKLQQLLKLKRYEQPHPRYFNDFSSKVLARIRAGKTGDRYEPFENLVTQTPWLNRFWRSMERQPAFAGAVAAIACVLMVAGVFWSEGNPGQNAVFVPQAPDGGAKSGLGNDPAATPALANNFAGTPKLVSSTNLPALLNGPNLFEHLVPGLPGHAPMHPVPVTFQK